MVIFFFFIPFILSLGLKCISGTYLIKPVKKRPDYTGKPDKRHAETDRRDGAYLCGYPQHEA